MLRIGCYKPTLCHSSRILLLATLQDSKRRTEMISPQSDRNQGSHTPISCTRSKYILLRRETVSYCTGRRMEYDRFR